jgi:mannose-6-phosphate isomerase-like protein (cupin superfamily)
MRRSRSANGVISAADACHRQRDWRGAGARATVRFMDDKVNLAEKLAAFEGHFKPKLVGELNDYKLLVVKAKGEFVWHTHPDTDDFFLVLAGRLTIQLRDRDIELGPGELFVVPAGVEHCPKADEEAHVLLIEPIGTRNTGDAGGELTAEPEPI